MSGAEARPAWVSATRLAIPTREIETGGLVEPDTVLEWDPRALTFRNSPAADRLITKRYRHGLEMSAAATA